MPLPTAVLDTNTVLDWMVFRDPATSLLAEQIESGALLWRTTSAMRREFELVLPRTCFAPWQPDAAAAAATWDRFACTDSEEPPRSLLLCADPDDQVFIDLAIHRGCAWLISRDRALLRLARRAAAWRVSVLTPRSWHTLNAGPPDCEASTQA
ncbi:MAG: PIN domain-containing protein [Methylibium sp.]|nr:PIN domain-containing protein [Methylibium sp.]